jgi:Flp pilus assembly protein TadD
VSTRLLRSGILFAACLVGIQLAGSLSPGGLNWGFHFLGFLPGWFTLLYLAAAAASALYVLKGNVESHLARASLFFSEKPSRFLGIVLAVFLLLAAVLRVSVPLLGDSFYLVRNYAESMRGVAPLYPRNEPLATYYFSLLLNARPISTFDQFMTTFFIADVLLGIGFIVNSFFIVRNLFQDPRCQLLSFLLILAVPYMQLFLGYVETYSVVLFALSLYVLTAVLNLREKISFPAVTLAFLLLSLVHYLTLLTLPSLLYLAYLEYRHHGMRRVLTGFGSAALILMVLLIIVDFDVSQFSASVPHHHYLSISEPADTFDAESQAYTLFSPFHAVDLSNYFILMSPVALPLLIAAIVRDRRSPLRSPAGTLFVLAVVPVVSFLFIVKFDLGAAMDWDVFAPYFFLTVLLAAVLFLEHLTAEGTRLVLLMILVSFLTSLIYFSLNSTSKACVRRFTALIDLRTVSHSALYGASRHLADYYHQVQDRPGAVETWRRFIELDPSDPRGHRNLITNLGMGGDPYRGQIRAAYDQWLAVDTGSIELRKEFWDFCIHTGNDYFNNGVLDEARACYSKAIQLRPDEAKAYNNLGSVYARQGSRDTAIELYRTALDLRPEYPEAMFNLGTVYGEKGDTVQSRRLLALAATLKNDEKKRLPLDTTAGHSHE